jgi:hypothetical protein
MIGWSVPTYAFGVLLVDGSGRLVAAGSGFMVTARDERNGSPLVIRECEEGEIVGGGWRRVRRLNGDETSPGDTLFLPSIAPEPEPTALPLSADMRSTGIRRASFVSVPRRAPAGAGTVVATPQGRA